MFNHVNHRPFPVPDRPWFMQQTWNDILFAHWPVTYDDLRKKIPPQLELDTYEGKPWIGVLPFYLTDLRPRLLPPVPMANSFLELNVRTYVTYKGVPGIYFFSLDAELPIAVMAARTLFHLPYYHAKMSMVKKQNEIHYMSQRKDPNLSRLDFNGSYHPVGEPFIAGKGTLEYWLTERYRLYTIYKKKLFYEDIHHDPWELQAAEASLTTNALDSFELLEERPLLHYSKSQKVHFWPLSKFDE